MASKTVLYVEDEEFDVLFMRRAFKSAGMEDSLQVVVDGQQAIAYLAGAPPYEDRSRHPFPSVVLLDLNLPIFNGFEVLQWARAQPATENLPICIFSSSPREEDKAKACELGAATYIQKPASALDFGQVVERLKNPWLK